MVVLLIKKNQKKPGMSYSLIANLPPIMGLHVATIAPIFYAFLGTSMQLSVGPVALVSIFPKW